MPRGVYQKSAAQCAALSFALQGNQNRVRHGESPRGTRTPEHQAWQNMRARCLNPKNPRYEAYGGRGIAICDRWDSYEIFLADMGRRPGPGYSLARVDTAGDYAPRNAPWA